MKKKVNLTLPDGLHAKAKIISIMKNIPLTHYLAECLNASISKDSLIINDDLSKLI